MIKKFIVFLLIGSLGLFLAQTLKEIPFGENRIKDIDNPGTVAAYYLDKAPKDLKVANTITAIVVNFRGFDTLGEVSVLFLAATGLASVLFRREEDEEEGVKHRLQIPSSSLMRTGAKILFPLILLLGIYVFIHGHLTPGGGFQGGAIIATGFLLMLITYKGFETNHKPGYNQNREKI